MAENWLDIIPSIELARGVPVVTKHNRLRGVTAYVGSDGVILADRYAIDQNPGSAHRWRVDLGDSQGFAYALRHLMTQYSDRGKQCPISSELIRRSLHTNVSTDEDRVALAKALREVAQ